MKPRSCNHCYGEKGKKSIRQSNPISGLGRPRGFHDVEATRIQDNRHLKVVRLSTLRTGRLYPSGNISGTNFCERLSQPQGHTAAGRIMSIKNTNETIGNRTHDLPACSAVPQPRAPPRGKTISIAYSECVSVGMRHLVICRLPGSAILHIIS
jgi:hypothetical protein